MFSVAYELAIEEKKINVVAFNWWGVSGFVNLESVSACYLCSLKSFLLL